MSHINDEILRATGGPTINDGLLTWYKANGATSDDINDAEYEFLVSKPGITATHVNDMWMQYLGNLGYSGALADRKLAYWTAQ